MHRLSSACTLAHPGPGDGKLDTLLALDLCSMVHASTLLHLSCALISRDVDINHTQQNQVLLSCLLLLALRSTSAGRRAASARALRALRPGRIAQDVEHLQAWRRTLSASS